MTCPTFKDTEIHQVEFNHLVIEEECAPPINLNRNQQLEFEPSTREIYQDVDDISKNNLSPSSSLNFNHHQQQQPNNDHHQLGLALDDSFQILKSSSSPSFELESSKLNLDLDLDLEISPSNTTSPSPISSELQQVPLLHPHHPPLSSGSSSASASSSSSSYPFLVLPNSYLNSKLDPAPAPTSNPYSSLNPPPFSPSTLLIQPSHPTPSKNTNINNNTITNTNSEIESQIPHLIRLPTLDSLHPQQLSLLLLGLPDQGAKTRVETQIKLTLVLILGNHAQRAPNGSLQLNHSIPNPNPLARVSNWSHVKLPFYSAIRRRSKKLLKTGIPPEETLFLDFKVSRATEPETEIWCCPNCQIREQKRTQRKRDARVRPAQEISSDLETREGPEDESKKIVVFNCGQYLEFGTGQLTLPTRITCYCRHHREKKGFCVKITLRDHLKRLVAESITPPIMITDDHKAVAAAAKAKSGSDDLESLMPISTPTPTTPTLQQSRQIRKLPRNIKLPSSKRFKRKPNETLDLVHHNPSDAWIPNNNQDRFGLQDDFSPRPSTAQQQQQLQQQQQQQSKRKSSPSDDTTLNYRDQTLRRPTTTAVSINNGFTESAPIMISPNSLAKHDSLMLDRNFDPSTTCPNFSDDQRMVFAIGDGLIEDDGFESALASHPPTAPVHHHRRKSSTPSLNRIIPSRDAREQIHQPQGGPLAVQMGIPTRTFGEHIDQSLMSPQLHHPFLSDNSLVARDALSAALDLLMPPSSSPHPHFRPGTALDLSLCSYNNLHHHQNSSGTDLSSSSSPDIDMMFFESSRPDTPTPAENTSPETEAGSHSGGGFCRSSGRDSPLELTMGGSGSCPYVWPSGSGFQMQFLRDNDDPHALLHHDGGALTECPNTGPPLDLDDACESGSPFGGMLGNVFANWNMFSTFLPTGPPPPPSSSPPPLPPSQPSSQQQQLHEEQRPPSSSASCQRPNIHPHLDQASIVPIPTTVETSDPATPIRARIQKIVPNEGPLNGGIEITILGSGFTPDMQVQFGGRSSLSGGSAGFIPIRTNFWSENTVVCIVPPAVQAGPCPVGILDVTVDQREQRAETEGDGELLRDVIFTYLDNLDGKLLQLALQVVGFRLTGQEVLDPTAFARQVLGEAGKVGTEVTRQLQFCGGGEHGKSMRIEDGGWLEDFVLSLLKYGQKKEEDAKQREEVCWTLRNESGQNLLHLAIWLGMVKVCLFLFDLSKKGKGASRNSWKRLVEGRDSNGCTALHFAIWRKVDEQLIIILLKAGARTYVRAGGMSNRTALELVRECWSVDSVGQDRIARVVDLFSERARERRQSIMLRNDEKTSSRIRLCRGSWSDQEEEQPTTEIDFLGGKKKRVLGGGTDAQFGQQGQEGWKDCDLITELDLQPILEQLGWSNSSSPSMTDGTTSNHVKQTESIGNEEIKGPKKWIHNLLDGGIGLEKCIFTNKSTKLLLSRNDEDRLRYQTQQAIPTLMTDIPIQQTRRIIKSMRTGSFGEEQVEALGVSKFEKAKKIFSRILWSCKNIEMVRFVWTLVIGIGIPLLMIRWILKMLEMMNPSSNTTTSTTSTPPTSPVPITSINNSSCWAFL